MNFVKFLRILFLQNTSGRLLINQANRLISENRSSTFKRTSFTFANSNQITQTKKNYKQKNCKTSHFFLDNVLSYRIAFWLNPAKYGLIYSGSWNQYGTIQNDFGFHLNTFMEILSCKILSYFHRWLIRIKLSLRKKLYNEYLIIIKNNFLKNPKVKST